MTRAAWLGALAAMGCAAPRPTATAVSSPPVRAATSAAAPVVAARGPEAMPVEFVGRSVARDVDGDGLDDLVMTLPPLPVAANLTARFDDLPPALVAHRRADGLYAVDDAVTRTALRALCPAPPPDARRYAPDTDDGPTEGLRRLEALFLDGLCHRVFGLPAAEAVARVGRSFEASEGVFTPEQRAGVEAALAALPVPLTLPALAAAPLAPLPSPPARTPRPTPTRRPPDPRCAPTVRAWQAWRRSAETALDARAEATMRPSLPALLAEPAVCIATDAGLWTLTPGAPEVEGDDDLTLATTARLTWTPAAPSAARVAPRAVPLWAREYSAQWVTLRAAVDYDGDGAPELIVDRGAPEGLHAQTPGLAVWSARAGQVRDYAPAAALGDLDDAVDVDGDGRLDLVLPSPWRVRDTCGRAGALHEGPSRLAHALPGGGFSTVDVVAREWMRGQCTGPATGPAGDPDVIDVACARLRGDHPEQIVAALHARWPAGPQRPVSAVRDGPCLTFQQVAATALVPAPDFLP